MFFFIIITFIVVTFIWLLNDKTNNLLYAAKPVSKSKPNAPIDNSSVRKPVPGGRNRKPVDRKTSIHKSKPNVPINNSLVGLGGRNRKPKESQLKYKNTNVQAPTYERLQKALAAYTKYNKSGKVDPSSSYADLVNKGYLKFENGKWTSLLDPAGKAPPVIGGPTKGSGSGSGSGGQTRKPGSGGQTRKPGSGSSSGRPKGNLSGGLANQAWDDYGNKYAIKTSVGDAKVVMTDTRNNQFNSEPKQVAEYNQQLISQGKIPMAYMNTGFVDRPSDFGNDKYFKKLYEDLGNAGVLGGTGGTGRWKENILDGKTLLNNPSALNKVKAAYTDFIKGMKSLGYKAINVDNLDFYDKGVNSKLSKSDQQKLGQMWQSTISNLIQKEGMYAIAKNAPALVTMPGSTYVKNWDGIVTENAKTKGWDDTTAYKEFADAGKPVWNFQTQTNYANQDIPNWIKNYVVGQGKQGWWENN